MTIVITSKMDMDKKAEPGRLTILANIEADALFAAETAIDSASDSPYLERIRNPTQPATLSWRPLVLCVLDVFLTA